MIDNPQEQLQRVVHRLRKVVEDYSAQVSRCAPHLVELVGGTVFFFFFFFSVSSNRLPTGVINYFP